MRSPDLTARGGGASRAALAAELAGSLVTTWSLTPKAAGTVRLVHAPGRVNLIGEHTDYNDGFVLPLAIDLGITIALVPTPDRRVDIRLAATGEQAGFDLKAPGGPSGTWIDYVAGTAQALIDEGAAVRGFRGLLVADLPAGAGLSSSAALELAAAFALSPDETPQVDRMALAMAARRAENDYVGVACGLMDQFASVFGQPGHALLLDCRSLEYRAVALRVLATVEDGAPWSSPTPATTPTPWSRWCSASSPIRNVRIVSHDVLSSLLARTP